MWIDKTLRLLNGLLDLFNTPGGHMLILLGIGWYGIHIGDMEIATFAGGAILRTVIPAGKAG